MNSLIDLHIHSNHSDGKLSFKQIIDEADKNNIKTISITDHDTISVYTDELFDYAKKHHINLIPGVEISTYLNNWGIHVLGYNFDLDNFKLIEQLSKLKNARQDYLINVTNKLQELGYHINIDKLKKIEIVTKAHIAKDIIANFKNHDLLMTTFNKIPSYGHFIEAMMNESGPAFVKKTTITPKKASQLIKQAGGQVVLAHPVCYKYEDGLTNQQIISLVNDIQADGIEAIYLYINQKNQLIDECNYWKEVARANNKYITIGSDFHQDDGIHPQIGLINYQLKLDKKDIDDIIYHLTFKKQDN